MQEWREPRGHRHGDRRTRPSRRRSRGSVVRSPHGLAGYGALRILGCGGWCWHGVGACPMIEVATLQTLGGPDMSHATFSAPDMTTYCGLEELGLVAVGMRCQGGGFVLKCRAANPARLCPGCGRPGYSLGSRTRRLAHEPRGASAHDAGGVCGTLPLSCVFSFLV